MSYNITNKCIELEPFSNLMNDKELELFESSKCIVKYLPDEIIIKQGTRANQIPMLTEGFAKSYIEGIDNKFFVLGFIKPFEQIIMPGAFVDGFHHYSVKALEESICYLYDMAIFKEIANDNINIYKKLVENISSNSLIYFNKLISMTQKQVNGRLAETLIYLQQEIYMGKPIDCRLSSKDLAEMTGMTKDTTVRILKDLKESGIIETSNYSINIIDYDRLSKISEIG